MQLKPFIQGTQEKPNRLADKKDIQYDLKWGRYGLWAGWDTRHELYLTLLFINKCFYVDNQWIFDEDLEAFLKGTSSQGRNRIKQIFNEVRPLVNQYVGNSAAMDITIEARAFSSKAINRREEKFAELMFMSEVSMMADEELASYMREKLPIGETPKDTELMFENIYVDNYVDQMNSLITYTAEVSKWKMLQGILGLDMCLSGQATIKQIIHNQDYGWKRVDPERLLWDRNGTEWDLSDCDFRGEWDYMSPAIIFERWKNLSQLQREAIERQSRVSDAAFINNGLIPVITMYFRDTNMYSYGYVLDETGYPFLTRINYTHTGEQNPRYTTEDLLPAERLSDYQKSLLGGGNTKSIYVDELRFIEFIPKEAVPCPITDGNKEVVSDIVLANGIAPFQDTELEKISNVSYPYKTGIWTYMDGSTYTPISSLINPQRMINRVASVTDNLINNAKPDTVFMDEDLITDKVQTLNDYYQGKPIFMSAKGRGMQNAVTTQGRMLDASIGVYSNLQASFADRMSKMLGVNDALMGTSVGQHQLNGVTQMQEERASVIQEPFYSALINIFKQAAQATCNVGKRFYIQNERELSIIVGDKNITTVRLSKDLVNEDFRVFVERVPNKKEQISEANSLIFQLVQAQIMSPLTAASLYGRSTMEQVGKAWRESEKEKMLVQQKQMEQQEAASQQQMDAMATADKTDRMADAEKQDAMLADKEADRTAKIDGDIIKTLPKVAQQQQRQLQMPL